MSDTTIYRSVVDFTSEPDGILTGFAIPWEMPTYVSDFGGPKYREQVARTAFDVSLRQKGAFPLFVSHGHLRGEPPIGEVAFTRAEDGLRFRAEVEKGNQGGAEALRLVGRGVLNDVSLGYRDIHTRESRDRYGRLVTRTESAIKELSLAPTGFGQYPQAKVLAMRSDLTFDETTQAVCDAITRSLFGDTGPDDSTYVYVRDISDEWAVYSVSSSTLDEEATGLFKVEYAVDNDGVATISDAAPVKVQVSYEPIVRAEVGDLPGSTVGGTSSTPRRDYWRRKRAGLLAPSQGAGLYLP